MGGGRDWQSKTNVKNNREMFLYMCDDFNKFIVNYIYFFLIGETFFTLS